MYIVHDVMYIVGYSESSFYMKPNGTQFAVLAAIKFLDGATIANQEQ